MGATTWGSSSVIAYDGGRDFRKDMNLSIELTPRSGSCPVICMLGMRVQDRRIKQAWLYQSLVGNDGSLEWDPTGVYNMLSGADTASPDVFVALPPGWVAVGWGIKVVKTAVTRLKLVARVWHPDKRQLGERRVFLSDEGEDRGWDAQAEATGDDQVLTAVAAHVHRASDKKNDRVDRISSRFTKLVTSGAPSSPSEPPVSEDERLLRHYAPVVRFYPTESVFPCSVEHFFERARALNAQKQVIADPINVPDSGQPSGQRIFSEDADLEKKLRKETDPEKKAKLLGREKYKLPLIDSSKDLRGEIRPPCYGYRQQIKIRDSGKVMDVYHYFFFYMSNPGPTWTGDAGETIGSHESDWEQVMIRTPHMSGSAEPEPPDAVYFASHSGGHRVAWDDVDRYQHPLESHERVVVYSAQGSHASYSRPGKKILDGFHWNDNCEVGPAWATWDRIVDIGWNPNGFDSPDQWNAWTPRSDQAWVKYYGAWGKEGKITGPVHNDDWFATEFRKERDWPAR